MLSHNFRTQENRDTQCYFAYLYAIIKLCDANIISPISKIINSLRDGIFGAAEKNFDKIVLYGIIGIQFIFLQRLLWKPIRLKSLPKRRTRRQR